MTVSGERHLQRIEAGVSFEWDLLPPRFSSLEGVPPAVEELSFRRVRRSSRGISELRGLRRLWAHSVDREFLDEICRLTSLETLQLEKVTAVDLDGLAGLSRLRRLIVVDATKVLSLVWVERLGSLEALLVENSPRVRDLDPLSRLPGLRALGVEGSMWTSMRVATLEPLAKLENLEWLFLTNLRVEDRSLSPLHRLPRLRVLECAKFFADEEFRRLALARPGLDCVWLKGLGGPGGGGPDGGR